MRILAIRGKNLASLAEPFEITLNSGALENAGLFAITGQTGAGKSTILDALCLALYDKIPRLPDGHGFAVGHKDEDENLRVTSNDVRSILRRGTSYAYAEVDFIGKDKHHYRARWEVSKARGKADGRLQSQDVTLSNIASGQRIGQGKKSTLEAIGDLIDLNFEQFRRSVLLAQGDFAAFLKAKKDERSSLLERITGTDIYSELSIAAFERAKQEKEALSQLTSRLQEQMPLAEDARLAAERLRDQLAGQVAEIDQDIAAKQAIIAWHDELKKRQAAEQAARSALSKSQQAWDAAEAGRKLIQQVEAAQPLRPVLAHYQSARTEHQDAERQLQTSNDQHAAAGIKLTDAKARLEQCALALTEAAQQQQRAQPLLIQARALDTRIAMTRQAADALNAEASQLNDALRQAEQAQQALSNRRAEQNTDLQRLHAWLTKNQALKPIAAEWSRWEAELNRYQILHARNSEAEHQANRLRQTLARDEPKLEALRQALAENSEQLARHQADLARLKAEESQRPFEDLLRAKASLESRRDQIARAAQLAQAVQELRQTLQQDTATLAATEQTLAGGNEQLHRLSQQQSANGIALGEAKKALELIQATTHKNAEHFRAVLQDNQPCPVCGALEHPWKERVSLGNEHAAAQANRVAELETTHAALIKTIAELTQGISHGQEQKTVLAGKLNQAQARLAQYDADWAVLELPDKPDCALTSPELPPALSARAEQVAEALATLKQQEQAALALQKQLKTTQGLFDAAQQNNEKLAGELTALDQQHTKHKTDLAHAAVALDELAGQLDHILGVLATPFQQVENWRQQLQASAADFSRRYAEKAQRFQDAGQQIETAAQALAKTTHDEQLAEQALNQCRQQHQQKQKELKSQTDALQQLSDERAAVLPVANISADDYEQTIQHNLQTAQAVQHQAAEAVKQAETGLAGSAQQQQHWQTETERRYGNLQKAQDTLNDALAKQALTLEQLGDLLEKDDIWLMEQKAAMAALERSLHEAAALLKVKAEDCRLHASQAVATSEEAASQLLQALRQQRQDLHARQQEQIILLREDDKKIAAGQALKAELERQQQRWEQWESLNELIGSRNGVKFRTFAQSLTLEALLAHSNQHLQDFAKRYALQRVPGSDLELQIIDRDMADDVRSVHSLSGGESFLVSLALALGLASLSSNKTQVESLFIDEGFGSLDPETLDIAIASLDTLQALGRKVGVISHVPILVERIGAKVVVEKLGGGRSKVVIIGGY